MSKFWNFKNKILVGFIVFLFFLNIFIWPEVFAFSNKSYLEINFFDIGQGDAIFIQTPKKHQILIDGGPNNNVLHKLAQSMPFWDRSLDMVILTHPDADHITGLLSVLPKYKIDYILWTGMVKDGALYQRWLELLKEAQKQGTKIILSEGGQSILFGNSYMDIIYPIENLDGVYFKNNANDTSIISRLVFRENSFLLTGDTTVKQEKEILKQSPFIQSDVLKVAHHGSKTSTSEEFLFAVKPDLAVIQAGRGNKYGHPTSEILQRLEKFGIKILRNDVDYDIKIVSDGNNIKIKK